MNAEQKKDMTDEAKKLQETEHEENENENQAEGEVSIAPLCQPTAHLILSIHYA